MIYQIKTHDFQNYKEELSDLITKRIINKRQQVTFIDCLNNINQYMFKRTHLNQIMDNLFLSRIETIHDLIDLLKSIHFNNYFKQSSTLIISSFDHLLEHDHQKIRINHILKRLDKEIVLLNLKWATQYPQNA